MKTIAVLVTYHPDLAGLETNLNALAPQVAGLVLVDNGSAMTPALAAQLQALPIPHQALFQPENHGLGQAQNAGIATARQMGAEAVLLMDQDSTPAPDMVAELHKAYATRATQNPAAIGANHSAPGRGTDAALPPGAVPEMADLIASGTLIPLAVFDAVGAFDEGLFIDFIDTEWGFRARFHGYRLFAARAARMIHPIGTTGPRLLGRIRSVHPPQRMYYQTRNLVLIARHPWTPRGWSLRKGARLLLRGAILSALVPPRRERLRAVTLGIWDGIRGKGGVGR